MKKSKFKFLSFTITILFVVLMMPMQRVSAATTTDGKFYYTVSGSNATITQLVDRYTSGPLEIPATINDGTNTYAVTTIGSGAFEGYTGLTGVTIPDSVTSIGFQAFAGCTGLKVVTIGSSVASIGIGAFISCTGLTGKLTIPENVTSIGVSTFQGCTGLTEFEVVSGNATYSSKDGVIYDKSQSVLICYPGGKSGPFTIPDSVTSIGEVAFGNCTGLTSVTISNNVTNIGNYAFDSCTCLTGVTIPYGITSIGDYAFWLCSGLKGTLTIPDSVTSIGIGAFDSCTGLKGVTIGRGVTTIGSSAFGGCTGLETINALPAIAPMTSYSPGTGYDVFNNGLNHVPTTAVLYILSGAIGYNIAPWTQFQQKVIYTVTYNINGGTGTTPTAITGPYGSTITLPHKGELSKSGYNFTGWNTSSSGIGGTHYDAGALYTIGAGDAVLYADWIPIKLTGIAITTPPTKAEYLVGQSLDLTGLVVTGTYNDGTTAPVTVTATNISGFNSSIAGNQKVTVTVEGKTAIFTVNVVAKNVKLVRKITVTGKNDSTKVAVNKTLQMRAYVCPDNAKDKTVIWSVMPDTGTAAISSSGLLKGLTSGTVTVVATAKDGSGIKGTAVVNVIAPVSGITVKGANNTNTVVLNGTLQMNATISPDNAKDKTVTWCVKNGTGSAKISKDGLLTGKKVGTVTVTAIANDGSCARGSMAVKVVKNPVNVNSKPAQAVTKLISDINDAINQLKAFINQVKAQRGKKIYTATADAHIAKVQQII